MESLKEKLEKIRDEKADWFILGAKLSPHQKDIFCEGFDYCQSELLPLIEEMRGALEKLKHNPKFHPGCCCHSVAEKALKKLQEYENQQGEKN
jgi:hypothetical protein